MKTFCFCSKNNDYFFCYLTQYKHLFNKNKNNGKNYKKNYFK